MTVDVILVGGVQDNVNFQNRLCVDYGSDQ